MPTSDYLSGDCYDDSHDTCIGHKRGRSHIPCNCECHDEPAPDYTAAGDLWGCSVCSAIVQDPDTHTAWHGRMNE